MQRQVIEAEGFHNSFVTHMEGKTSKEVLTIKKDYAALVKMLSVDYQRIPSRYKIHKLKNKGGLFEGHLGGRGSDTLLLFRKLIEDGVPVLQLVRVCTHSELNLIRAMAEDEDAIITASYIISLLG